MVEDGGAVAPDEKVWLLPGASALGPDRCDSPSLNKKMAKERGFADFEICETSSIACATLALWTRPFEKDVFSTSAFLSPLVWASSFDGALTLRGLRVPAKPIEEERNQAERGVLCTEPQYSARWQRSCATWGFCLRLSYDVS